MSRKAGWPRREPVTEGVAVALYVPEHDEQPFLVEVLGRYLDEVHLRPLMGRGRSFWAPAAQVRVMISRWVKLAEVV